jgi:hypothetical protein
MTITAENLTGIDAERYARFVEQERRIDQHFEDDYRAKMSRREGACLSGFDPRRIPPRTEDQIRACALAMVRKHRRMEDLQPYQTILNIIADRTDGRDADSAALAQSLRFASQTENHHLVTLACRLDATADRHPDLRRDVADAKHCLDAMVMLFPEAA